MSSGAAQVVAARRRLGLDLCLFLEQVERDVDVDRAGPPAQHRRRRLAKRQGKHVDARRLVAVLDHRADDVREVGLVMAVDFLERTAVELRRRHVGGDGEEGRRIGLRNGQRHHQIGRAWTARGQRGDGLVADTKVGVGHVSGDLLVARRDQRNLVADVVERVQHADVAMPADPEDVGDCLRDQELGNEFRAFLSFHPLLPGLDVHRTAVTGSARTISWHRWRLPLNFTTRRRSLSADGHGSIAMSANAIRRALARIRFRGRRRIRTAIPTGSAICRRRSDFARPS